MTALINGTDYSYDNMDKKQLNLECLFGTVDHTNTVKKLDALGIMGILGEWFTSFLSSSKHFC